MTNLNITWSADHDIMEIDYRTGMYEYEARGFAMHTKVGWVAIVNVYPYKEDYVPTPLFVGECKRAASANEAIRKACYSIKQQARKNDDEAFTVAHNIRMALK